MSQQMIVVAKKKVRGRMVATATALLSSPSRRRQRNRIRARMEPVLDAYAKTLADPWEHGPVQMGFLTLLPTTLGSAYQRNSITVNADGSFAIALCPSVADGIKYANSGLNTATWSTVNYSNKAALNAQMTSGRVVSAGIRCFALFPETSASGVLFGGSLYDESPVSLVGYTPNTLSQLASAELGIGSRGARVVSLPRDSSSLQMFIAAADATGFGNNKFNNSVPYIIGQGFPAGTVVWYEAILNMEGLPAQTFSSLGIDVDVDPPETLASRFPNFETAMSMARRLVGNPAVMDGAASLLEVSGFRRTGSILRSAFGTGGNWRRSLVAGANALHQGRQGRILIEEMKEEREA